MIKIYNVAILLSTYNGGNYLGKLLQSLYNQKGNFRLHIYVRDDGSTDNTLSILYKFRDSFNNITILKGENNLGPAKSFLTLLRISKKFDFYFFCDQDDIWKNDKVERAINKLNEFKVGNYPLVYFSNATVVDSKLRSKGLVYKEKPHYDFYTIISYGGILGCTICFNSYLADLIKSKNMPSNLVMHDSFTTIICVLFNGKIIYDSKSTILYRQHGDNSIGVRYKKLDKFKQALAYLFKKVNCTIPEQLNSILKIYGSDLPIDNEKEEWIKLVLHSEDTLFHKINYIRNDRTSYRTRKTRIISHMSIFLGNY